NKLHINLFLRNIDLFKNEIYLFDKFLNQNNLNEYKIYLNSIGILTKDRFKNLLIKLKNQPNLLINQKLANNGFPFDILFNIYKLFEINTKWFEENKNYYINENKNCQKNFQFEGESTEFI